MGNLCSTVANGINYVLRIVFPFYTSFLPAQCLEISEEKCLAEIEECYPRDGGMSVQYNDESSAIDEDDSRSSNAVANLKLDKSIGENTGNAGLVFSIVKDFFRNYSFQTNLLGGNLCEKRFIFDYKNDDEDIFLIKKENCCVENSREIVSVKEIKDEKNKLENEDFPSIRKNEERGEVFSSKCLKDSKNTTNKTAANGFSSSSILKDVSNTVNSRGENLEEFSSSTVSEEGGMPSVKTSGNQELLRKFSFIKKNDAEDNWWSDRNKSVQPRHANKPYLRKLSLPQMQSGCHFSVHENDENVILPHYNSDSPPLDVPVETHRKVSHPNLYSGGLVAFEELSEHLSLPNYYTEDPIIYEKQSYNFEIPQCPTAEDPEFNSRLRNSGGRVIADNSRRVSLPDLFPEKNSLLRQVSSEKSTQNSASFGVLMNPIDEEEKIFADLLSKSKSYDLLLTSQTPN